ncbi:MAG TPA: toll/interleukin-1 receptor domain-containing protein, partial [Pyrinomonadaceae bacterium]|nr:toll/interleukin-1 receptor domain-containing protein [Pyrinomonadaceae bacterium]
MKVFISWSGERSKAIAEIFRDWLPSVIPGLELWLSLADIDKGARWRNDISEQLEQTQVGIICLTPENLSSHWLLFEAGALSKMQRQSYVCTFLYDIEPTNVKDPLAQFQYTIPDKEDVKSMILSINRAQGENAAPHPQIEKVFDWGWAEFEGHLSGISRLQKSQQQERPEKEILKEVLELVRSQARLQQSPTLGLKLPIPKTLSSPILTPDEHKLVADNFDYLQRQYEKILDQLEALNDENQVRDMLETRRIIFSEVQPLQTRYPIKTRTPGKRIPTEKKDENTD